MMADYPPCIDCPLVVGDTTAGPSSCCRSRYVQVASRLADVVSSGLFSPKPPPAAPVNRAQRRAQQKMGIKPRRLR